MSNNLGNYIYERTIDYIQNRARDNLIRDEYDRYMGGQNYNNQEMGELLDVITVVADSELDRCRTDREVDAMVNDVLVKLVDSHVGFWALGDRRISEEVPDDVYRELERAAQYWNNLIDKLTGGGGGGGRRSVFDERDERRRPGSARRSVFDGRRDGGSRPASNSVFGNRQVRSVFDGRDDADSRSNQPSPQAGRVQRRSFPSRDDILRTDRPERTAADPSDRREDSSRTRSQTAPAASRTYDRDQTQPTPRREEQDGPDMSLERPYDDFWLKGEHWQIAHKSQFVWTWTPQQQTRRSYNPDKEVCFLVKAADGTIREEFIPMTDDLIESAHEIRELNRPFRRRPTEAREEHDVFFESDDLDTVNLDLITDADRNKVVVYALKQFMAQNSTKSDNTIVVGEEREAVVRVSAEATKTDAHATAMGTLSTIMLPGDEPTLTSLKAIAMIGTEGGDLGTLRRRLLTLRGEMAENVLQYLDTHFTKEINDALNDQFGLVGLKMDSFLEDFDALLGCKRFTDLGASYAKQFLARTRPLLTSLAYILDQEERLEILEASDTLPIGESDPEAYTKFRENTVLMFRTSAFVHAKLNSDELGVVDETVRVPASEGPDLDQPRLRELYKALYSLGRETTTGRVYLVTADYMTYELVPISGARDIVGIRVAGF